MEPDRVEGDPDTLAALEPVELIESDDEPTAAPPDSWDMDAHAEANAADPAVDVTADAVADDQAEYVEQTDTED